MLIFSFRKMLKCYERLKNSQNFELYHFKHNWDNVLKYFANILDGVIKQLLFWCSYASPNGKTGPVESKKYKIGEHILIWVIRFRAFLPKFGCFYPEGGTKSSFGARAYPY